MDTTQISHNLIKYMDSTDKIVQITDYAPQEFSHYGTLINLIISLCIILAIIFLIHGIIKKYWGKDFFKKENVISSIRILSKTNLGYKKYLCVVEFNGEQILIGVTESNISLLSSTKSVAAESSPV